ncbi:tripartite tricarboxylate transporter substrate-binding protein [Cupriavidus sp. L7L]|uniref:tripartite tricarboxylate transporter substrate-binding protein n=1 Tax=Cupriavidus sp. L7L TaxID=2546443 RepID=UPI001055D824|nr:tripartite tricarboxylate transporter substrate-binding protein [Cupriavidus sp. L7L]TDF64979.1 ABC transporter substrate-binding protein [Cupriavidus sp. L7L]
MDVKRLSAISLASALCLLSMSVPAEDKLPPVIRLVVGYPPGGSVDYLARSLAEPMQKLLQTTVIVENRPGAGGRVAAAYIKTAPTDGSVVLVAPNALTTLQSLIYADTLPYKLSDDFTPVSRLISYPLTIAVPASSPVKDMADLRAWMKGHSAEASYGSSGAGGFGHFSGLVLGKALGISWVHAPYKGGAPLVNDLAGGHLPAGIDTIVDQIPHHRGGKIRILATLTSARYALAPDIPSVGEQGIKGVNLGGWTGLFVSSKVPAKLVEQIDRAVGKAMTDPTLVQRLNAQMIQTAYQPTSEFRKTQAVDLAQWAPVLKASGFKPE